MSCGRSIIVEYEEGKPTMLAQHVKELRDEIAHLNGVIASLEADKAELARDERRIDWMDGRNVVLCSWPLECGGRNYHITEKANIHNYYEATSLRRAIDLAMQSSQGGAREGKCPICKAIPCVKEAGCP